MTFARRARGSAAPASSWRLASARQPRRSRRFAPWLVLGAGTALALGCGASRAAAVADPALNDAGAGGSPGVGGAGDGGGAGGSAGGDGVGDAGSDGAMAGSAGSAPALPTLCSTNIGPCQFESAQQCPPSPPEPGSSCPEPMACFYCPVSAASIAVSNCVNGRWSSTSASCGG